MKWTTETPTASGWYWLGRYGKPPVVVRVSALPGGYYGVAFVAEDNEKDLNSFRSEQGWRWAGPLHVEKVPEKVLS